MVALYMNRYVFLAATSFLLAAFTACFLIILSTEGVSYSPGVSPDQLEGISYQEASELMQSQATPVSYAQAIRINITSTFFWWQVFLLSSGAAVVSTVSSFLTDKWLSREST